MAVSKAASMAVLHFVAEIGIVDIGRLSTYILNIISAIVVRKGTAQVHHVLLRLVLEKLRYIVELWIERRQAMGTLVTVGHASATWMLALLSSHFVVRIRVFLGMSSVNGL